MSVVGELEHGLSVRRLGQLVDRVQEVGFSELEPLSVFLERGVVRRADASDNHNALGADLGKYQRVLPGDLVFNRLRTWQGGLGASRYEGIVSPAYIVLRPRPGVDSRYLQYVLLSRPYLAELTRLSKWMPPSQFDILWEDLRTLEVPLPGVEEQRRIADFLDDRVARIDQIIAGRRQQHDMVALEAEALLPRALTMRGQAPLSGPDVPTLGWALADGWRVAPLGRLLAQLTNGFVGPTRDILTNEGVRYIQGTHIKHGTIDFQRHPYYVSKEWARSRPRILLRPRDILMVQTGAIGEVAMVPDDFGEASCHALLIARTNNAVADPAYLTEYLRSASGQVALLARATGALHPHLEFGIKSAPILLPPLAVQRELATEVRGLREQIAGATGTIIESIALLQEYKQSLITAAVTGELDVTTASSRIPE